MTGPPPRLTTALADRYRIDRELGRGGMATVYLAEDLRHKRRVAVKVLKPELAAVLGAERFVQEITTTAALQHPHILPLFDSGEADGFLYYVMPFIDGETLRSKLDRETQLGIDHAVRITSNVADALDYAHRNGVIHRDIKPENILLHDGRPMVADFGIALAVSAAAGGRMTETGMSLGTPHYMSPEQATADKDITGRSDIFSLGSVLYEMLTGSPPHAGASPQQIIMKIVTEEAVPVTKFRKAVPPNVEAAVATALEKLPADRFETAKAFAEALGNTAFTTARTRNPSTPRAVAPARRSFVVVAAAAALIVMGGLAGWLLHAGRSTGATPVTRVTVPVPGGHEIAIYPTLAISDDGRTIAYFSAGILYKRRLDRDEAEPLGSFNRACCLRFTRDGRALLFQPDFERSRDLWSVPLDGGPAISLSGRAFAEDLVVGAWGARGLFRRRAGDTAWHQITTLDSSGLKAAHVWPQLLDGGRSVLYTSLGPSMMWQDASVVLQDLESGAVTTVATGATYGRYVSTGHILYIRADGALEAQPFDLRKRRITGNSFTVQQGVRTSYWGGAGSFDVSDAGTFVFTKGSSWQQHRLTWLDREGKVLGYVGEPVTAEGVRLSPDERYAVTYIASPGADIARFDVATGEQRRLTFDARTEDYPIWTPDGRGVTYRQMVAANDRRIFNRRSDGEGSVQQLYAATSLAIPLAWSPDGSVLLIGGDALLLLHVKTQRVDTLSGDRGNGQFSPDGRWLVYTAREGGREEIFAVSYPALQNKQQISRSGGRLPFWSAQSGELFFITGDTLMATTVSTRGELDWTAPKPLFRSGDLMDLDYRISATADGRRFLLPTRNPDAAATEIQVVFNWFDVLRAGGKR